jgi:hypothetical protein
MKGEIQETATRLSKKYNFPEAEVYRLINSGLKRGLSLKACEIGLRMFLGSAAGDNEFFTIEDMQELTGASQEELIKQIEQIRQDAVARGENPDNYAIQINPNKLN